MSLDPLTGAFLLFSAASTVVEASNTIAAGNAAKDAGVARQNAAYFRAKQEDMAAQESRAATQRQAMERRREAGLLSSQLTARAAASGGGATDPTIIKLGEDITARGEYQALMDMYRGENRARGLEDQAIGDRYTGDAEYAAGIGAQQGAGSRALGTILGGAGSIFKTLSPQAARYG